VRVVGGRFGGRRLKAPSGLATRPTSDRVRESLFAILGPLDGVRVLDLFAGSGALGIEALSRGASEAVFVESDHRAAAAIEGNLKPLNDAKSSVVRRDALAYLREPPAAEALRFGLVLIDPPYSFALALGGPLSELLPPVLSKDARVVTESPKLTPLELTLPLIDERTYGDTRIAIHRGP